MRLSPVLCLLAASVLPAFAAVPQYAARVDTATGLQSLTALAAADFNGDGRPDIAVTSVLDRRVLVFLGTGTGTFSPPVSTTLQIPNTTGAILAGDFNEDGRQDLVVGTVSGSQASILLTGNGDGTFTQQPALPGSSGFLTAAAADLNWDGHLDLVTGGNSSIAVYLGDGRGGFTQQNIPQGAAETTLGVAAGDFNSDGKIDFVASGFTSNSLRFFAGTGTGSFAAPVLLPKVDYLFAPASVLPADFNGDGRLDLLVSSADLGSVIFGNGDGTFQLNFAQIAFPPTPALPPGTIPTTAPSPAIAIGDMDGDGKPDAVLLDKLTNSLNIDINDGTGKFPQRVPDYTVAVPAGSVAIALADLNRDGLPDIIFLNSVTQNLSVILSSRSRATPVLTLSNSVNAQLVGTPLTLTARVTGSSGTTATGPVTLLDGTTVLGQQALDTSGRAVFSIASLSSGTHTLSASFPGDPTYLPAVSNGLTQAVTDFQLSLSSTPQAVNRGSSATYMLTLSPIAGFTGAVTLTCSGLPATSACAAQTATLGSGSSTLTLSVTTTAAGRSTGAPAQAILQGTAAFTLASMLALPFLRRRHRALARRAAAVCMACTLMLAGCGTTSQAVTANPAPGSPGSPSGSTPFIITGTATQAGITVQHTVSTSLIVN